ncbi:MAG: four helix bundle protein [Rikenellaceae bacterium]|nr:four helix bundle protein [Rikenellaceae bacterium]
MQEPLVKYSGDHKRLLCYQKCEVIYDITYYFAHTFLQRGDRTIDQMVQAARSGKQNIIEGNADLATSYEMGIKLLNVAKASLKELLADYEDFLRVNGYSQWPVGSKEYEAMRQISAHGDNNKIVEIVKSRPANIVANMAIILIKHADFLLFRYIESLSERFTREGGFKERMYHYRIRERKS